MNNILCKLVVGSVLSFSLSLYAADIHRAVEKKDLTAVKKLIKADKSVVNLESSAGVTPLHIASAINSVDMVDLLVKNGASIGAATKEGFTPLHFAASRNHPEVVRNLLDKGADTAAKTRNGKTALQLAQQQKADAVIALLQASGEKAPASEVKPVTEKRWWGLS